MVHPMNNSGFGLGFASDAAYRDLVEKGIIKDGEDVLESIRADLFEYAKAHSLWNPPSESLYEQKLNPEDLLSEHAVSVDDVGW